MGKKKEEQEVVVPIGPDENGRYYYKAKSGNGFMNLKSPLEDENYIEITKEEFDELTYVPPYQPSEEETQEQQIRDQIFSLKAELAATDYVVIKIAESDDADEIATLRQEYAQVIAHRREIRAQINELEENLND